MRSHDTVQGERHGIGSDILLNVRTEILPSDEAQARMAPSSCGAQDTELTSDDNDSFRYTAVLLKQGTREDIPEAP